MKTFIYPSSIETARALILHLIHQMESEPNRIFHIAFSGGNTPSLMYDLWANEYKNTTPWQRMRFYFVDERCVPPENSESNYGVMRSLLLSVIPIPYNHVFPINGAREPHKEAERYAKIIDKHVPKVTDWPVFDIVLLGAGEDGHTSSIFPGQEYLLTSNHSYEATYNPNNGQHRIAMTGNPMLSARRVIFLLTGKAKGEVVEDIFRLGDTGPASYIAHHAPNVEFFLDSAAAEKIQ